MVDNLYIRTRIEQSVRLAGWLKAAGVPVVEPTGSDAVFVDARAGIAAKGGQGRLCAGKPPCENERASEAWPSGLRQQS